MRLLTVSGYDLARTLLTAPTAAQSQASVFVAQPGDPPHMRPLFLVTLSAYRLMNAAVFTAFATARLVIGLKSRSPLPTIFEWIVGVPLAGA